MAFPLRQQDAGAKQEDNVVEELPKNLAPQWAKEAMERISHDGLMPIPDNYAVYFAYVAGSNPNLRMSMDVLLKQYGKLNQQHCSELFQAYLSLEAEHRVLRAANASIEAELKQMVGVLSESVEGTNTYRESLNDFSGALDQTISIEQIRAAMERVANETRVITEQNERLHAALEQSTQQLSETRYNLDQVRKESLIDPLTEVGNRKFFSYELARTTAEATETGAPLSLLILDIDHFKKFNDTHGHLVGDQVLRLVAQTMIENLKGRDIIARYGGEEFVILLPQTSITDAERVGDQLRANLATKQLRRKNTQEILGVVTISIGCTQYVPLEELDTLIARADSALYEAKQTGRNKVMSRKAEG